MTKGEEMRLPAGGHTHRKVYTSQLASKCVQTPCECYNNNDNSSAWLVLVFRSKLHMQQPGHGVLLYILKQGLQRVTSTVQRPEGDLMMRCVVLYLHTGVIVNRVETERQNMHL